MLDQNVRLGVFRKGNTFFPKYAALTASELVFK